MSQPTFDAQALYAALKRAIAASTDPAFVPWRGPDGDDVVFRPGSQVGDRPPTYHEFRVATGTGRYNRTSVTLQANGSVMYQRFAGEEGDKGLIAYWGPDGSDVLGGYEAIDVEVLHRALAALATAAPAPHPEGTRDPERPRWSELLQVAENDDEFTHVAVGTWGGRLFLIAEDVRGGFRRGRVG
jgi:hypothetical protein